MSRFRTLSGLAKATACAVLLVASACGEDGRTAPERCAEPPLPIYDIQIAGAPDVGNPCVTPIGHAVSSVGPLEETTGGAGAGG